MIALVKDTASKYNGGNMSFAGCTQAHDKTQAAFVQIALIWVGTIEGLKRAADSMAYSMVK